MSARDERRCGTRARRGLFSRSGRRRDRRARARRYRGGAVFFFTCTRHRRGREARWSHSGSRSLSQRTAVSPRVDRARRAVKRDRPRSMCGREWEACGPPAADCDRPSRRRTRPLEDRACPRSIRARTDSIPRFSIFFLDVPRANPEHRRERFLRRTRGGPERRARTNPRRGMRSARDDSMHPTPDSRPDQKRSGLVV